MRSDDIEARRRMWTAMLQMTKLDLATLQAAYEGHSAGHLVQIENRSG